MRIDETSLAFGYTANGAGNPNWSIALGQSQPYYKINLKQNPGLEEILIAMVYCAIPVNKVTTRMGKGGRLVSGDDDGTPIVSAALFPKVYVNDVEIENEKFILLIDKDQSPSHSGRLRLRYSKHNSYNNSGEIYTNENFYNKVGETLNLAVNACWFVYDISVENQDTLRMRAVVVNKYGPMLYPDSQTLHSAWKSLIISDLPMDAIIYVTDCVDTISNDKGEEIEVSRNRIFFGAPGTGKSHELDKQVKQFVGDDSEYYERVTFHPEYSHSSFFGTYKPVINPRDEDKVTYAFVPGPFLRVLTRALINANSNGEKKPYVLIIEEINRANVSAVFGEVFQLLDREGEDELFLNASKYSISPSEDVKKYLVNEFQKAGINTTTEMFTDIRIPDNMFVWASMNSADQGVFPMDTAFKRRWDFEYFGINQNEEKIDNYYFKVNESVIYWNVLRKAINKRLTSLKINEDKLMGPFFLSKDILYACVYDHSKVIKSIQNKVIMYLFEDAGRQKRKDIFTGGYEKTYSEICEDFEMDGINIFVKEIVDEYNAILAE